jgi:hypothetical protein
MEAVNTYETSVSIYQTTRRNIPEDSRLQDDNVMEISSLDIVHSLYKNSGLEHNMSEAGSCRFVHIE